MNTDSVPGLSGFAGLDGGDGGVLGEEGSSQPSDGRGDYQQSALTVSPQTAPPQSSGFQPIGLPTAERMPTLWAGGVEMSSPTTIAFFELSNGNTARFLQGEDGELIFTESAKIGDGERLLFSPDQDLTLLDVFLMLTTESTPLPIPLIERHSAGCLSSEARKRKIVEKLGEPVRADLDQLGIETPAQADHTSGSGSCGSNGFLYFNDHHCFPADLPEAVNYVQPIYFCDAHYPPSGGNSVWFNLTRNSAGPYYGWEKRWLSYERTAACGTSATVFHEKWEKNVYGWGWYPAYAYFVSIGTVTHTYVSGPTQKYRRVRRHRHTSGGGMRAFTVFDNNF